MPNRPRPGLARARAALERSIQPASIVIILVALARLSIPPCSAAAVLPPLGADLLLALHAAAVLVVGLAQLCAEKILRLLGIDLGEVDRRCRNASDTICSRGFLRQNHLV